MFSFLAIDFVADFVVSGLCILLDRQPVLYSLLSVKETVSSHVIAINLIASSWSSHWQIQNDPLCLIHIVKRHSEALLFFGEPAR